MEENNQKTVEEKKKMSKKSKVIITISIIALAAIVGIGIYAMLSQKEEEPEEIEDVVDEKPIIYLYPEETTEITVRLGKPENITCSYPEYKDGWNVTATPDGTLIDAETGRKLYSLYWEGMQSEPISLEEGFVVKGADTAAFLEDKLEILGLNEFEAEEFIVYWLPKLQNNEYNYIRFAKTDEINKNMPLEFSVEPDTLIRILMEYKALDSYIEVKEQKLETPERKGFVAVEWGGTEIK